MSTHFHIADQGLHDTTDELGESPVSVGVTSSQAAASTECYQKALRLWLQWNEAYESATATMDHAGNDRQALEEMLDRMDWLRAKAIKLSRHLLK